MTKVPKISSFVLGNFTISEIVIALFNMYARLIWKLIAYYFAIFRNSELKGIESNQRVFIRHLPIYSGRIPFCECCSQLRTPVVKAFVTKPNLCIHDT